MPDFDMGKYAAYVWPAWGISAVVLLGLLASVLGRARRAARALRDAEAQQR